MCTVIKLNCSSSRLKLEQGHHSLNKTPIRYLVEELSTRIPNMWKSRRTISFNWVCQFTLQSWMQVTAYVSNTAEIMETKTTTMTKKWSEGVCQAVCNHKSHSTQIFWKVWKTLAFATLAIFHKTLRHPTGAIQPRNIVCLDRLPLSTKGSRCETLCDILLEWQP